MCWAYGLVCKRVFRRGVGVAAGHHALSMSVNAEHCKEIYDRLQTPGIKHNAKLRSAGLNQTHNPSSFPAWHYLPPSVFHPHLALPATHLSSLLTSLSASFVS